MRERDVQSDLVRVVAMFFVIAVHTPLEELGGIWWVNYFTRALFFTCNAMFFMLSGKYNLRFNIEPGKEKQYYKAYYSKKLIGIVVPFIVYSFLLYLYEVREILFDTGIVALWNNFWHKFFCENHATHLWFMYSLIGMLLCAPFLARMLTALSDFEMHLLVILIFVWSFLKIILCVDILNKPFVFNNWIFEGWIVYFILGFYCDKLKKHIPLFVGIGVAALILTTLQKQFCERSQNIWDLSPLYALLVLGVYLFIERICVVKSKVGKELITVIAKYSFSVYIVHYAVKDWVVSSKVFVGLNQNMSSLALWLFRVVIIFVISFVIGIVIDSVLINNLKVRMRKCIQFRVKRNEEKSN